MFITQAYAAEEATAGYVCITDFVARHNIWRVLHDNEPCDYSTTCRNS